MPPVSPSNQEICDGIDNDGDGIADAGLISECYYPGKELSFNTCYPCPPAPPSPDNPVPVAPGKSFIFASDCSKDSSYDISSNSCIPVTRMQKIQKVDSTDNVNSAKIPTSGAVRSVALSVLCVIGLAL